MAVFDGAIFDSAVFDTGPAVSGVKHKKRRQWTVRTPIGTFTFGSEGQASAFIGREQRRLAAERKQLAAQGVFTPKVKLAAVRADLEPDEPALPSAYFRVPAMPEMRPTPIDAALVVEMLSRQDDEDAMALILEHL